MKRQPGAIGTRKQPRNESPLSQRALSLGRRTKSLLREPLPFVLQRALEDFRVTYELNAYCEDPERMYPLYSELHRNIQDVFNEHGVQIMTPAYVTDPEEPKIVPQNRWYEPPARTAAGDNPTSEAAPTGSAPSPRGRRRANQLPES